MNEIPDSERAIQRLQELGLKEYEAKAFVALTRRDSGTAKEISETSEVPRTRVYDAVRVLEAEGLVEIQHSNPQQFRAVSVDEAVETLKASYEKRTEDLRKALYGLDPVEKESATDVTHEVWALSGGDAIANRTNRLIDDAQSEVVLVVGHEGVLNDSLSEKIEEAEDRGVSVLVGATDESLQERVQSAFPDSDVFLSGNEWLTTSESIDDQTAISRLLLVDREAILISSIGVLEAGNGHERAVFGRGFDNGLVTITRRVMMTGLPVEPT